MDIDDIKALAEKVTYEAGCREQAGELGLSYEKVFDEKTANTPKDLHDLMPLSIDLVQFVLWLRDSSDFFGGPNLDQHYPKATDPGFYEVLADLAITYTGE